MYVKNKVFQLCSINNNRENIINNIKQNAQNEANIKSEEIINQGRQKLANIEEEISKKGKYINEVQEIKSEYEKISKKVSSQEKKLTKAKSIYNRIQYILEKFEEREITYISKEEFEVNESEYSEYPELNPTVQLKLNSMDLKELRKAFNENEKAIKQTLERYESRYTTKTNATIYKLMVIALKAEQQNILYNLKYDKLEKSIEDVKKLTDKYMKIAMDGNQSIVSTMRKFIGEIEYLFIKSVEIEYEYYVQKEKQREEQIETAKKMPKDEKKKIYKKVFANIILGIVVTLYFIGIGIGFLNIDGPTFITDLKVFSLSILAIAIILFEFAYGKDDDKTALYGVEMLFVAIMSLVLLYTCILHKDKFIAVANIVACIGVLYYLVKSISIYIREKLKWKKTISDVKEIVAEE